MKSSMVNKALLLGLLITGSHLLAGCGQAAEDLPSSSPVSADNAIKSRVTDVVASVQQLDENSSLEALRAAQKSLEELGGNLNRFVSSPEVKSWTDQIALHATRLKQTIEAKELDVKAGELLKSAQEAGEVSAKTITSAHEELLKKDPTYREMIIRLDEIRKNIGRSVRDIAKPADLPLP